MKKNRKVITIILVIAAVALAAFAVSGVKTMLTLQNYKQMIAEMKIENVDLTKVADGTYMGHAEAIWVAADVDVTVKDHKITGISLVNHKNGKGQPAEVIPDRVIEKQSLEVDIVSGATSSSKVILKAIENALGSKAAQ